MNIKKTVLSLAILGFCEQSIPQQNIKANPAWIIPGASATLPVAGVAVIDAIEYILATRKINEENRAATPEELAGFLKRITTGYIIPAGVTALILYINPGNIIAAEGWDKAAQAMLSFFGTQFILKTGVLSIFQDSFVIAIRLPSTFSSGGSSRRY